LDEGLVEGFAAGYGVDSRVFLCSDIEMISRVLAKGDVCSGDSQPAPGPGQRCPRQTSPVYP
jgi:hypothetical protein